MEENLTDDDDEEDESEDDLSDEKPESRDADISDDKPEGRDFDDSAIAEDRLQQMTVVDSTECREGGHLEKDRVNSENAQNIPACKSTNMKAQGADIEDDDVKDDCTEAKVCRVEEDVRSESLNDPGVVDSSSEFCDKYGAVSDSDARLKSCDNEIKNSEQILSGPELVEYLKTVHTGRKVQEGLTTIGMVRPKKYMCEFTVTQPTLVFGPDHKGFYCTFKRQLF